MIHPGGNSGGAELAHVALIHLHSLDCPKGGGWGASGPGKYFVRLFFPYLQSAMFLLQMYGIPASGPNPVGPLICALGSVYPFSEISMNIRSSPL